MTLTQLRYLVAIAENGCNISRAAGALHTSQPGISRQVRLLELELGASLLNRQDARIVGLTETGLRVLATARRILKDADDLKQLGSDFLEQEEGKLTVATLHPYALAVLPPAVAQIRRIYPGVVVDVRQASPSGMIDMVRAGDVDLGITIEPPGPAQGLLGLGLASVPRVLIATEGHPLLDLPEITIQDIARHPMICQEALASSSWWGVSRVFRAHGFEWKPVIHAMDASVIQAYVAQGAGIAILPSVLPLAANVRSRSVEHLFGASELTALLDPQRHHRGFVLEFIRLLAPALTREVILRSLRQALFAQGT